MKQNSYRQNAHTWVPLECRGAHWISIYRYPRTCEMFINDFIDIIVTNHHIK